MKVNIKRIENDLPLPKYETGGSVGFDLYSRVEKTIAPGEFVILPANVIIETPHGYMLAMIARSGTFRKKGLILPNSVGVFDNDFCGEEDEMLIQVLNMSDKTVKVERGERIAQGVFVKVDIAEFNEVQTMKEVSRGGLGSTGQ